MNLTNKVLREKLFEVLESVKSGEIDFQEAQAAAKIGQVILNSAALDLKAREVLGREVDALETVSHVSSPKLKESKELPIGKLKGE